MSGQGLNPAQLAAATDNSGRHLLVLAGAGTGKTKTIIARVVHLIESGVAPHRILLLTFTRRAATEMKERLALQIGRTANEVMAGTFHFFCLSVIKRLPNAFGVSDTTVIDRDDQENLMKMARAPVASKDKEFPKANLLVNYYSYARNTGMDPLEYLDTFTPHDQDTKEKMVLIFADYDKRKNDRHYLDFDDILHLFAKKVAEEPRIRQQIRGLFDHILVDEMQDTNPLQWEILQLMYEPARLFCVGDDAQSIYAFRGADYRNVHSFTERVPNALVVKLEENYRSTQEILDLSNYLLDQSALGYNKRLTAARGPGEKPVVLDFNTEYDEARWVAQDILEAKENGAKWRDHMILVRTGRAAGAMEGALADRKIPYLFIGGMSVFQSAHVRDLLSLLRVADTHFDELAWMRFLPLWKGVGGGKAAKAITEIAAQVTTEGVDQVLARRFPEHPKMAEAVREVRKFRDEPGNAVACAYGFLAEILSERYDKWRSRAKDFTLLEKLGREQRNLREFIESYTMDPVTNTALERAGETDIVTLITVHSAKGTEAPTCYMIQAQQGMYPHSKSLGNEDAEEEERRIAYVALTRAKNRLVITRALSSDRFGGFRGSSFAEASREENSYFFEDVPETLVEVKEMGYGGGFRQTSFRGLQDF